MFTMNLITEGSKGNQQVQRVMNLKKCNEVLGGYSTKMNDPVIAHRNAARHRPGMTSSEVVHTYNDWESYDVDMAEHNYRGPRMCAETVEKYLSNKKARILDIAAGTGFVAEHLSNHDFIHIDALEPSHVMTDVAAKKNVYTNYFSELITDQKTSITPDTYDCVVTAGGMGEGHIPCAGLDEMLRIAKQGAIICIVMRLAYLDEVEEYKNRLEPKMDRMELDGKWTQIERTVVTNYSWTNDGVIYVYKKL